MAIDQNRYRKIVSIIIDKLEGGYYHPDMLQDGRVKDQRYSNSGETMFGIDRKAGGSLNTSPAGLQFWSVIDNANARKTWPWNYKGGSLGPKLAELTAEIMYPEYEIYAGKYLSPAAKQIVDSDDRLLFNFIYATWNGPGEFQKFSNDFNASVASGVTNPDELVNVAISSRVNSGNSLIKQGGLKILGFINTLNNTAYTFVKKNWLVVVLIILLILFAVFLILFRKKIAGALSKN